MFGFFKPKPLLCQESTDWVKLCYKLFLNSVGNEHFDRIKMILPQKEYFPDHYDGSYENVRKLLDRICEYMHINHEEITLKLYSEEIEDIEASLKNVLPSWEGNKSNAVGFYIENGKDENAVISINHRTLHNPVSLIATISHELCHYILLKRWKLEKDIEDMEVMTDLLTIFLGMGIFTANSALQFNQWTDWRKQGWSIECQGYLTQEGIGYAIAEWAYLKNDKNPQWIKYLCPDVKSYCKSSLRYLKSMENA